MLCAGGFAVLFAMGSTFAWEMNSYTPLAWRKARLVGAFRFGLWYLPALAACVWFLQRASKNLEALTADDATRFVLPKRLRPLERCWHVVERVYYPLYDTWHVKDARRWGVATLAGFAAFSAFEIAALTLLPSNSIRLLDWSCRFHLLASGAAGVAMGCAWMCAYFIYSYQRALAWAVLESANSSHPSVDAGHPDSVDELGHGG